MTNFFDQFDEVKTEGNFFDQFDPAPEPRDTTVGEKAKGLALDLAIGTQRATKAIPDLASFILPDAVTDPASEFFERGIDAAEALKPEAFKAKQRQTFVERDAEGEFAGLQLPSFEHLAGITTSSLPLIPSFLLGGGAAATGLKALPYLSRFPRVAQALGYGTVNAALVAPDQWRQTHKEALEAGQSEAQARESADAAALMTAALSGATGAGGGAIASRLGAGSSNIGTAVAKGFVGEAPFEGIEEAGQSAIGDVALDDPINLVNALEAGLSGAGAGGVPGAGIAGLEFLTQQPEATAPPPEPTVEETVEAAAEQPEPEQAPPVTTPADVDAARARLKESETIAGQSPVVQEIDSQPSQRQPDRGTTETTSPTPTLQEQVDQVREAEKQRQAEVEALEERSETAPPRPKDLLQILASGRKLDRASFQGDLNSGTSNVHTGGFNSFLFTGKDRTDGMTPEELLEFMQEEGFLPENDPNSPNKITAHDAVNLLNRAISGERIIHPADADAELDFLDFERFEEELARMSSEDFQEAEAFFEESNELTDEELEAQLEAAFNANERNETEDTATDQAGQATRDQAGLLEEPTAEETNRAAEEAKTAERDGLGRDEVPVDQGEGELFAGNEPGTRPEQTRIESAIPEFQDFERPPPATPEEEAKEKKAQLRQLKKELTRHEAVTEAEEAARTKGIPTINKIANAEAAIIDLMGETEGQKHIEEARAAGRKKQNKLFTEEKADAARERLKSKAGTLRSGVDPEMLKDMGIIAGFHVEQGIRDFAEFSRVMIQEIGDRVKPHLKKLFEDATAQAEPAPKPETKPTPRERPAPSISEQTSTKNVVTDAERAARDLDPIMKEARQSNPEIIAKAEQAIKNNPDLIDEVIDRLNNTPEPSIDVLTEAVLFIAKVDNRREMRRIGDKIATGEQPSSQGVIQHQGVNSKKYADLLVRQHEIDQATHASGAVWGRLGQLRSRMMNDDYSFEAQARAAAARLGGKLTPEQLDTIEQQSKEIERLTAKLEKANQEVDKLHENFWSEETYEKLRERFDREQKKTSKKQKRKTAIKNEVDWLLKNAHRLNALPVDMVFHMGKLGGLIIADGANTSAEWVAAFKDKVGEKFFNKVKGDIDEIYAIAQDSFHKDQSELIDQTLEDTKVKAEALGEMGEELTHKLVYDLARLHILKGMRGENKVMAAVHADLAPHFEGLSERDVRRLFSEYGKAVFPSQEEDKKALRELRVLVRLQESIDRIRKDSKDPKRTGPQRDKATQNVREKQRELDELMRRRARANPTPSREKLASIDEQRVTRLTNRIADLEKEIATGEKKEKATPVPDSERVTLLKKKVEALKDQLRQIEEAKHPKLSPEEKYNVLRGKQLRRELAEVSRRLREKDYGKRVRKPPPSLSEANKALRAEVIAAKNKLHEKQAEWIRSQLHPVRKFTDFVSQSINLSRAAITSIDLSAVLRQGGFKMLANPSTAIKSFIPMMRALKNDANANAVNDEIVNRPNFDLYQKAKLHLSEQDSAHPTKMEEVYMGRWQKKVPGIAASGRAYVTFLNKLRADSFDSALEAFAKKGEALSIEELRQLASYINNATGRFDVSKAGAAAGQGLSNIFFAPRWMLSRFAMIMGAPMWSASPRMRRYIAGEYVRFMLGFGTLFGLAALAFAGNSDEDDDKFYELDPRSSDFGKVKIGNTRLDMAAGLSQPIVFLSRIISGGRKNSKGEIIPIRDLWRFGVPEGAKVGFGQDGGFDVIARFTRSKFAPPITAITNISAGENVVGETYEDRGEFGREVLGLPAGLANNPAFVELMGLSTPLSMRDFYDALQEQGYTKTAALQVLATFGVSMNTYSTEPDKKKGRPSRKVRERRPKRR